jgi:hypothetical protein
MQAFSLKGNACVSITAAKRCLTKQAKSPQGRRTAIKLLKNATQAESKLDIFDIENFYRFFKELYTKRVIPRVVYPASKDNVKQPNLLQLLQNILNKDVDSNELKEGVKGLKTGKAAGEDGLINEFLKTWVALH